MPPTTKKLAIAAELLDRALILYYEENSNFAALHLAGGAEELLGKHLKASGLESSFESLQSAAVRLSKYVGDDQTESDPKAIAAIMNRAKNATKHMAGQGDGEVHFDARSEAHDLLDRAVTNYYQLMGMYELPETELIGRFNRELVGGA